ncbi:MAG: cobaltochelatase subunit CobN [Giesbergeria sp.]|nr:cobaltochelatase subunit CobN [Giesbergeria sp.]
MPRWIWMIAVLLCAQAAPVMAADKVALISSTMVLERKFTLMQEAARAQGVELAWTQVDAEGEKGVARVLDGARMVIVDAPRNEDQALVERLAGPQMRAARLSGVSINVMSPPVRLRSMGLPQAQAQRVFEYYVGGMRTNHERLFQYLKAVMNGSDASAVLPPVALPNGGVYHPDYDKGVFADLRTYLAWWQARKGGAASDAPVIGMEMSSSYLSDGQTRVLDETISALEARGALPLVFYRSSRVARAVADAQGAVAARPGGGGPPAGAGGRPVQTSDIAVGVYAGPGFPNPKELAAVEVDEPIITLDGKVLPQVLLVNTFLGINPDARKAWHRAMGVPVINMLSYRQGTRAEYLRDTVGVSSFNLPFSLTNAEYIGLQDPVVVSANEGGELVPMPEQMDLLVGKAVNLARLQSTPNADKRLALFFWNHPPGEKNQGASNLIVPRSLEHLVQRLRTEGYRIDATTEKDIIATVATLLRPAYRPGTLGELMKTPHWDFLPLARYERWLQGLPADVRQRITTFWGDPTKSPWVVRHQGQQGFVIPRMKLGQLVVLPQPMRSETAAGHHDEKKLFHDTKVPLNHFYLATYLWAREQHAAHAIVHFGTHGSQEWTPGKERGLWAYDDPNLLVGNTPVIYPYIVDNIGEALHVKRRGRGVIVSHQTPAFAPAGLSEDFVRINDLIREYQSLDSGLVRDNNRKLIIAQAVKMNIHKDMQWKVADLERDFDKFLRDIEDYLEDLGAAQQPLGLHTLGLDAERAHLISNVMQMLGQPLYEATGVKNAKAAFKGDYKDLQKSPPYRFVDDWVFSERPLHGLEDTALRALAEKGRRFRISLRADWEVEGVLRGLSARWIDPSYGGDPIRNPDALHTGRNMYGFDPSRIPTRAAYEAGKEAVQALILSYQAEHGKFPEKLAFSMWSTETLRHLGMLEAQVLYAMGARPRWDEGGRVVGMEVIPLKELGRARIDTVISLTGLYRDQFPNVMERFNEAIALLAAQPEPPEQNFIRANTERIEAALRQQGVVAQDAREFALTRVFGNESGDYSTKLTDATLASDTWEEGDGKLEKLNQTRMSWAYGPNTANWSRKLTDPSGREINTYAEHLKGTSAAVFSRSSNLRGLLDTDHPFEYLGGISMAVKHLDGTSPQLYISNMRDPNRARLQSAEKFMATELRSVYQHPNWMKEMMKEGYSGTLQMLNTVNNFWGWQVMDRNVVRDDQWQEFHETYVKDRYQLGTREWFEKSNPTALAQVAERMLEAIRKDYWKADERTQRELVATYQDLAARHDVHTSNETFKAYVAELAQGFGIGPQPAVAAAAAAPAAPAVPRPQAEQEPEPPEPPPPPAPPVVRGQELREVLRETPLQQLIWAYAWLLGAMVLLGVAWQGWRAYRLSRNPSLVSLKANT